MSDDAIPLKDFLSSELVKLDENLDVGSDDWIAAMFLLASVFVGCNADEVARAVEIDPSLAHTFAHRARKSGIWSGDPVEVCDPSEWTDEELGGVAFWMSVSCLTGGMKRLATGEYSMTEAGKRRADQLLAQQ